MCLNFCIYIYIYRYTHFYEQYIFKSVQYHFFPEIVYAFIIKVFFLITKFLLKMGRGGALAHGLTFFKV